MSTVPHPDEAAFLAAIGEQPADALPRLIFADWLDEHGRADEAAWLRADVRLAQAYPDRRVETAVLWTRQPCLMHLHPDIVRAALARTTIP